MYQHKSRTGTGAYKEWARENYRGVENLTMPSFLPDFVTIDEAGIRHDVRQAIAHGFFATACVASLTTVEQTKEILRIACDEARGRILVSAFVGEPTREANLELLQHAKAVGCSHAIVVPRYLEAGSDDEVYAWFRDVLDAVDLPVCLYAQNNPAMRGLHPSGMSLDAFERLSWHPKVVALKLSLAIDLMRASELAQRVGDRVLIGTANLALMPMLAKQCRVQWSGQWSAEAAQSPQKPYVADFVKAVEAGALDRASQLYWAMLPALNGYFELQAPMLLKAMHPWTLMKYYQWLVGGNGGLVPDTHRPFGHVPPPLTAADRQQVRENFRKSGINVRAGSDDEFVVGVENARKGVRRSDLASLPLYA